MPASGVWLDHSVFFGSDVRIYGGYLGNESDLEHVEAQGAFLKHPLIIDAKDEGPVFRKTNFRRTKITLFGIEVRHARGGNIGTRYVNGSALETRDAEVRLFHTRWSNNEARSCGAMLVEKSVLTFATITIFENNTGGSGGAINAIDSTIVFDASAMFNGNRATEGIGGALRGYNTRIVINLPVTFINNQAGTPDANAEYKDSNSPPQVLEVLLAPTKLSNSEKTVKFLVQPKHVTAKIGTRRIRPHTCDTGLLGPVFVFGDSLWIPRSSRGTTR